MKYKYLQIVRLIMFLINCLIIIFMSTLIYQTSELICANYIARDFLEKIKTVPLTPWKVPVFSLLLMTILTVTTFAREFYWGKVKPLVYVFTAFDIGLCVAIMYYLNMSYKGVILLAITNIIIYMEGNRKKYLFVLLSIAVYVLLDYDIFSIKMTLFSVNDYIQHYTSIQRLYIFGIRNILVSLNEVLFIVFVVIVIQNQVDENRKIKDLYDQLYQTAAELEVANIHLQEYGRKSEEMVKTTERNRLAREIHDTVGHTLTGIATGLEACLELIEWDVAKTRQQLGKITDLAKQGLVDIRRSVRALRPDAVERLSLLPAVQKLADDITDCTKTKVMLSTEGEIKKLWIEQEETAYRLIQEGITNAVRHGKAKKIIIAIKYGREAVRISIKDDGSGCQVLTEGFGLKHIREMVENLNGTAEFSSCQGSGFQIEAFLPGRWH